jgi:2OG-Fe(II) oxygenase superfamily
MTNLRQQVFMDVNPLTPPHPGFDAESARLAQTVTLDRIFNSVQGKTALGHLQELEMNGFVVVDNTIETSRESNDLLGQYLWHKTGQGDAIRTDTVGFLSRDDAVSCGLGLHFDVLMGIASYLNHNLQIPQSGAVPIAPATFDRPLTIPEEIQAAEYGEGGFYVAHSDNSWAMGKHLHTRNNYRSYTAILYCNEDWAPTDGGALRIYKDSTLLANVQDACNLCDYTDVFPKNGRLVIFDSALVHAVRKVKSAKVRRALTVWLTQPTEGGVLGEIIDVPP